jgi:hypothetical protein
MTATMLAWAWVTQPPAMTKPGKKNILNTVLFNRILPTKNQIMDYMESDGERTNFGLNRTPVLCHHFTQHVVG